MENIFYVIMTGLCAGFILGFSGIGITILLKKRKPNKGRHGFGANEAISLKADESILSSGRQDYSSQSYK